MYFITNNLNIYPNFYGYLFHVSNTEYYRMLRVDNGAAPVLHQTPVSYISNSTWYGTDIERTLAGQFTVDIKGGSFGNTWTLVNVTGGSGTNPVTDNTYTTSEYYVLDLNVGDKVIPMYIYEGIEQ